MDHACFVPCTSSQETSAFKVVEIGLSGLPASTISPWAGNRRCGPPPAETCRLHRERRSVPQAQSDRPLRLRARRAQARRRDHARFRGQRPRRALPYRSRTGREGRRMRPAILPIMAGAVSDVPHTGKLFSCRAPSAWVTGVASFLVEGSEAASPAAPVSAGDLRSLGAWGDRGPIRCAERLAIPNWVPADLRTRRARLLRVDPRRR